MEPAGRPQNQETVILVLLTQSVTQATNQSDNQSPTNQSISSHMRRLLLCVGESMLTSCEGLVAAGRLQCLANSLLMNELSSCRPWVGDERRRVAPETLLKIRNCKIALNKFNFYQSLGVFSNRHRDQRNKWCYLLITTDFNSCATFKRLKNFPWFLTADDSIWCQKYYKSFFANIWVS